MRKLASSLAFAALALLVASSATADVPPPPGYVESCTVDKQQTKNTTCASCSTYHGDRDKCAKTLGAQGFSRSCKTRGASVWTEVWCKPTGAAAPAQLSACLDMKNLDECVLALRAVVASGKAPTPQMFVILANALETTWGELKQMRAVHGPLMVDVPAPIVVDVPMQTQQHEARTKAGSRGTARILPNYEDGKLRGIKLTGVRPNSVLRAIGLRSGDVILAIDGKPIATAREGSALFSRVESAKQLRIDLERQGKPMAILARFVDKPAK